MIHQLDHRWATYVDNPDKPNGLDTDDVSTEQKKDPSFAVRPRYWVDEREVLARIARVPSRVANAWLAWRHECGLPGNLVEVTGARGPRVLGARYPGKLR